MNGGYIDLPKVSIIIPVFNGEAHIKECIEDLLNQNYPSDKIEIIIVDDGSTDRTLEMVNDYEICCIRTINKGPANARNIGIKAATGDILIFIDSDCMSHKNLVINHVLMHMFYQATDPSVQIIGGSIEGYNQNYWSVCDDFCSWYKNHPRLPETQVFYHPTANMSITKHLGSVISFDEELRYAEDYTFCTNAIKKGYKIIFQPKAKVLHINRTTYKSFMGHAKNWASSQTQLMEKGIVDGISIRFLNMHVYIFFISAIKMLQIIYFSIRAKRINVVLYVPFIFFNTIYSNYFEVKARWKPTYFSGLLEGIKNNNLKKHK